MKPGNNWHLIAREVNESGVFRKSGQTPDEIPLSRSSGGMTIIIPQTM